MCARLSLVTGLLACLALGDPVPAEAGDTRVFIGVPSVEIYSPPVSIQFGAPRYYPPYYYYPPPRYYYPGPAYYYGPRYYHHHRYHPHRRYHRDYYYRDRGYRRRW